MHLADILTQESTLRSAHLGSKKRVLEQLSKMAFARITTMENSELSESFIFEKLVAREKIGSTALGQGVAIPHARLPEIKDMIGIFLLLDAPIDFQAPDKKSVDLFFALLVPEEANENHLKTLAHLASLFKNNEFRNRLRHSKHSDTLYEVITEVQS